MTEMLQVSAAHFIKRLVRTLLYLHDLFDDLNQASSLITTVSQKVSDLMDPEPQLGLKARQVLATHICPVLSQQVLGRVQEALPG